MVPFIKINPRHGWAVLSAASSAASTLLYLYFFWHRSDGVEFIHLYSTAMLFCSWLNTFCYFFEFKFFHNSKIEMIAIYAVILFVVPALRLLVFSENTKIIELGFLLGIGAPTALAPLFRHLFREGKFRVVYALNISINAILFLAVLFSVFAQQLETIYLISFLAFPMSFMISFFFQKESLLGAPILVAILNPTLLILERTLFEQKFLIHSDQEKFTLPYYLLSRCITFTGTVLFTVGLERSFRENVDKSYKFIFYFFGVIFLLASLFSLSAGAVAICGQVVLWMVVYWLTAKNRLGGKNYFIPFALCVIEILVHWGILFGVSDSSAWILRSLGVLMVLLATFESQREGRAKSN